MQFLGIHCALLCNQDEFSSMWVCIFWRENIKMTITCPVFLLYISINTKNPVNRFLCLCKGYLQINTVEGLPWWCSGWESACQCRGHGFEPWSGKIPHAAEQLGPWATIAEPARLEPVLHNKRGRDGERPARWWRVAPARRN